MWRGRERRRPGVMNRVRRVLYSLPLALTLSIAAVLSTPLSLFWHEFNEDSSLAILLSAWPEHLLTAMFGIGGAMTLAGLLRGVPRVEATGWSLMGGVWFVNVYSIIAVRGSVGQASATLFALGLGSFIRSWTLAEKFPRETG